MFWHWNEYTVLYFEGQILSYSHLKSKNEKLNVRERDIK